MSQSCNSFSNFERIYSRGYYADLVLVDLNQTTTVKEDLLYQCGWSPFEGTTFEASVEKHGSTEQWFTIKEKLEANAAMRLTFNR